MFNTLSWSLKRFISREFHVFTRFSVNLRGKPPHRSHSRSKSGSRSGSILHWTRMNPLLLGHSSLQTIVLPGHRLCQLCLLKSSFETVYFSGIHRGCGILLLLRRGALGEPHANLDSCAVAFNSRLLRAFQPTRTDLDRRIATLVQMWSTKVTCILKSPMHRSP
jgi:hypothetical protein